MAWAGSTRRSRLPSDWPTIRGRILRRDGHRCTWIDRGRRCTAEATEVDHRRNGDDHSDTNLRSLCEPHHARKSAAEGGRAPHKRNQHLRLRPTEPHPGIIRPA